MASETPTARSSRAGARPDLERCDAACAGAYKARRSSSSKRAQSRSRQPTAHSFYFSKRGLVKTPRADIRSTVHEHTFDEDCIDLCQLAADTARASLGPGGGVVGDCIVPGCGRNATNNLGVRLRKADTSAIWAPNANAYVCDRHARSGARITLIYEATDSGRIELNVQGAEAPTVRRTAMRH
jgi:hypothetical protein